MKSFVFSRFLQTMKWDFYTNLRYNIRHWLIMLTLFFFAILLPHACVITEGDKVSGMPQVEEITDETYQTLSDEEKALYTPAEIIIETADEDGIYDTKTVQGWQREFPGPVEKWEDRVQTQHTVCAVLLLVIVSFYFTFSASLFLNNMTTKQRRITFLALPASRTEKLLARWLYAVPFWFLMVLTAFCAADLLRYVVQPAIGPNSPGLMITWLWTNMGELLRNFMEMYRDTQNIDPTNFQMITALIVMYLSNLLFSHSTYILGSSLFPRFPWLVTTGIIWVFTSVVSILMVTMGVESMGRFIENLDEEKALLYMYVFSGVMVVLSIVFYVLAVRVFRRMQVINHKFMNL